MKAFQCDVCGNLVFFDNVRCVKCGHSLGFLPQILNLSAFEPVGEGCWRALAIGVEDQEFRLCANGRQHQVCNWMVPAGAHDAFCLSCRFNEVIPDLNVPANRDRWLKLELAKRRIIYTVRRLGLPTATAPDHGPALRFSFLGSTPGGPPVHTGHLNGLITINVEEADDDERERRRVSLHEPYRTLLGHLRHEIAHYYWDRLIAQGRWLGAFREMFGDERRDYAMALREYYQNGPAPDWAARTVSAYASSHPWEDWAETWAHYCHIVDAVETAASFGMVLKPSHAAAKLMSADPQQAAKVDVNFNQLLENWFPLTYALNALNRGMGLPDLYPFSLSAQAIAKLKFVHDVIQAARTEY